MPKGQSRIAEHKEVREWVLANRGIIKKIAESVQPPVSPSYVQQVIYGEYASSDHRVIRELKAAGWPGIRR